MNPKLFSVIINTGKTFKGGWEVSTVFWQCFASINIAEKTFLVQSLYMKQLSLISLYIAHTLASNSPDLRFCSIIKAHHTTLSEWLWMWLFIHTEIVIEILRCKVGDWILSHTFFICICCYLSFIIMISISDMLLWLWKTLYKLKLCVIRNSICQV